MREDQTHDRAMIKMRAQYWDALPTRAYVVRRLIRKRREPGLEPGEREELELTVQRISESGAVLGFQDVSAIAVRLTELLALGRSGQDVQAQIEAACDDLDRLIDDMTLEALAASLRSLWHD